RAATIVICTHLDQFLEEKRGSLAELQEWARDTNKLLRADYPAAGVCGVLLANCKDQKGTRTAVLNAIVEVGKAVLAGRKVPKFMEDLHKSFNDDKARQLRPAWALHSEAVQLLAKEGLADSSAALFALES